MISLHMNTSSSIAPVSVVKAVWPLDTRLKEDNATLTSYVQSLIEIIVLCRSPVTIKIYMYGIIFVIRNNSIQPRSTKQRIGYENRLFLEKGRDYSKAEAISKK